jgi:hypothetical protein
MKPYNEKHQFYSDLGKIIDKTSVNGQKYLLGDFNARLGARRPGEEDVMGEFTFGREAARNVDTPNRDLMMEFCIDRGYFIANTIEDRPPENKVTYFEPGVSPMAVPSPGQFTMLDLLLVPA